MNFETLSLSLLRNRLNVSTDAICLASVGRLFQALIEDGRKEFEYRAVHKYIVC